MHLLKENSELGVVVYACDLILGSLRQEDEFETSLGYIVQARPYVKKKKKGPERWPAVKSTCCLITRTRVQILAPMLQARCPSFTLHITVHHQEKSSRKKRGSLAYWLSPHPHLLSCFSYTTQTQLPRDDTAHSGGALLHQLIKKMPHRPA